jgi:hypothetical protein
MVDNGIALPLRKVATPAIFHLQYMSSERFSLAGQETCHSSTLTFLNHTSQFSAIIAKNLNFRQRLRAALRCRRRA